MARHHVKEGRPRQSPSTPAPRPSLGDWHSRPLVPAVLGLIVSAYLLALDVTGGASLCIAGSDCDVVRSSTYSRIAGLPVSIVGLSYFLLAVWLSRNSRSSRSVALLFVAGAGAGAALVFLGIQAFVLHAYCPYCIVAEVAALWLLGNVIRGGERQILVRSLGSAACAAFILIIAYAQSGSITPVSASTEGLAQHLQESGATFYGAYWCPHCQEQKALFGASASKLPYVECDARGQNAQPNRCTAAGIRVFPTWVIDGQRYEGTLSLAELARRSGYVAPPG